MPPPPPPTTVRSAWPPSRSGELAHRARHRLRIPALHLPGGDGDPGHPGRHSVGAWCESPDPLADAGHETFLGKESPCCSAAWPSATWPDRKGRSPQTALCRPVQGRWPCSCWKWASLSPRQCQDLRRHGLFLLGFALLMPLASAGLGLAARQADGALLGGLTLRHPGRQRFLYCRTRHPAHRPAPGQSRTVAERRAGVTFPFNIMLGIRHSWARHFME